MRIVLSLLVGLLICTHAHAVDDRTLDKQLEIILRDVHDRGANLHNSGDSGGCYRMYQGGLLVARQMIAHRPDLQKTITTGLQNADREPAMAKRSMMLHELIESVRLELAKPIKASGPEKITIPPREVTPQLKPNVPKTVAQVGEIRDGVVGRVIWQGQPLEGVELAFVSLGIPTPKIYESISGTQGIYAIGSLPAGKYLVILKPGPKCPVKTIPERYELTNTTPIKVEIKARGEKFDFFLQ